MKSIGFASNLVPLVKNGEKTLTYRLGGRYDFLEVGDFIQTYDSATNQPFGTLEILNKSLTKFKDLPLNRPGHENYETEAQKRQTFESYYGKVEDDQPALILELKYHPLN